MNPRWVIEEVEKIVSPVYLVGGSVRDMLLGREPKDYDFCTPLSPDEIEAKVKEAGRHAYLIGKKFGTIGFRLPLTGGRKALPIEVTTFRTESYQPGNRKPQVEFVKDLDLDLSRRDFTFNAIALHNSQYYDPFAGRMDILAKKIIAVGDATDRFREDPLRMLRAARFASQLGFEVDPNMIGKIRKMPETILGISRERWVLELDKLLIGNNPEAGLKTLMDTYLMKYMLPEVWQVCNIPTLYQELVRELQNAPRDTDTRWGILLKGVAKPIVREEVKTKGFELTATYRYRDANLIGLGMVNGIGSQDRLKFSSDRMKRIREITLKDRI